MKYSIVIPTYNHCSDLLEPCVNSLLKYTDFNDVELVIVANGCTDGTRDFFDSLNIPHKVLVWRDEAIGYTKAANLGIQASQGEFVVLLNNDTEILPSYVNNWLNRLHAPFANDPLMSLTGSLKLFDHDIKREFIVFCCAMIRRSVFQKIGLLDEIFSPGYGEDIDFAMRVEAAGLRWECVDQTQFINGNNIGTFPLWHKNNKTFGEIPEYPTVIVQRNRATLIDRYNRQPTVKYSIVIPTYNHCRDLLKPCLESIRKYTDMGECEVVVVANGCTDETREYVESLGSPFKLVWSDAALGYTKATNLGINAARGKYIVLMNNDTVLLHQPVNHWLNLLRNPFDIDPTVGITGPMRFSWDCGGVQREAMAFWLVMIPRAVFDKVGILDEIFSPGMGEDGDFSIRVTEAGYKLISVPNDDTFKFDDGPDKMPFPIWHMGNGTFNENEAEKNSIILRNNKILNYRWGMQSKKDIKISIIIPTARHFHQALKPGLEAVFKYTDLSDKEIIVVANGAPEEARAYLNEHSDKLSYIWSDAPTGVIKAYNAGIKASRGQWIVLLDDDSHLQPQPVDQWIHILQKPFLQNSDVGATGPFAHWYEDMGFVLHSGCAMYDAALLKRIGGFDEAYNPGYFSDPDVSMRIWRAGYRCVEVPENGAHKPYVGNMFQINFPVVHTGTVQTMDKNKDIDLVTKNRELLYAKYGRNVISSRLQERYDYYCNTPIDIHEHLPTIRRYAQECFHITEFGTRYVVSTYAFMAGKPTKLVTYDLYPHENIWTAASIAQENNVDFSFMERDTTQVEIEPTDLLFIDTLHTYAQCKKELELHASKARKYIMFHDTVSFGYSDEGSVGPGLMPAITEFLAANPQWQIKEHYTNCNGLMILERVAEDGAPLPVQVSVVTRKPKYSVVIPTYNHCDDLLKPCIDSIVNYSTMEDLEVIVVANGCVDGTREYMEGLPSWAKLIWVDEAIGYTKATNLGIKAAQGDYVILLNNDTELLGQARDQWLKMLVEPFSDPTVGLTGPLQLFDRYANSNVLIFFCVMVKKELFDKIGLLDEIFTPGGGEDIDFTVRANLAGYQSVCITETKYSPEIGTNVGQFPIWHKDNRTFRDISEYSKVIVKRNGLVNCKRYNKDIKLNLGAGGIEHEGYLSVDLYDSRAHIQMDITKLDFNDGSVSELLASHVFEHLNPYHALDILKDWCRVLKPGGKLIMEMPDLERICKAFVNASTGERYGLVNAIYGSVNTTGVGGDDNITSPHLFGWWPGSLWDHLTNAGFTDIQFMDEKLPHPPYGMNFRVEAVKPGKVGPDPIKIDHEWFKQYDIVGYNDVFGQNNYGIDPSDIAGKVVIDIGANVGMFTARAVELGAKHVYAVEAQPTIYKTKLIPNVGGRPDVTTANFAVTNQGSGVVYLEDNGPMSKVGTAGEPVLTTTLANIVADYGITDTDPVLKLDCEGAEFDILLNADAALVRKFKTIFMELHGSCNINPAYHDYNLVESKLVEFGFKRVVNNRLYGFGPGNQMTPLDVFVQKWERV